MILGPINVFLFKEVVILASKVLSFHRVFLRGLLWETLGQVDGGESSDVLLHKGSGQRLPVGAIDFLHKNL